MYDELDCNLKKLVIFGAGGVGKTALVIRLVTGHYDLSEIYDPSICDLFRKTLILNNGEVVTLDILDTAGQEEYRSMRASWVENADGFLLVYDMTKKGTLDVDAFLFIRLIRSVEDPANPCPILLVGTKLDLVNQQQVSLDKADEFSKKMGLIGHVQTSAKTATNVEDPFFKIARKMSEKTCNQPSAKRRQFRSKCIIL